jgi:hypothetical protein
MQAQLAVSGARTFLSASVLCSGTVRTRMSALQCEGKPASGSRGLRPVLAPVVLYSCIELSFGDSWQQVQTIAELVVELTAHELAGFGWESIMETTGSTGEFEYCSCMATKTITLELDAYEKLRAAKKAGESFSEVVRRAVFAGTPSTGAKLQAYYRSGGSGRGVCRRCGGRGSRRSRLRDGVERFFSGRARAGTLEPGRAVEECGQAFMRFRIAGNVNCRFVTPLPMCASSIIRSADIPVRFGVVFGHGADKNVRAPSGSETGFGKIEDAHIACCSAPSRTAWGSARLPEPHAANRLLARASLR